MGGEHARLSPSNHAWVRCPGSIRECEKYQNISSDAAIDGTGTHLLIQEAIEKSTIPGTFLGRIIGVNHEDKPNGWNIDQKRIERANVIFDYMQRRLKELEALSLTVRFYSESKSNPGEEFGRTDWWGTVDLTITGSDKENKIKFIEVVDYKDGQSYVSEKNNPQLLAYLFGKFRPYRNFSPEMRMTIIQPKTKPLVRYQDITTQELVLKSHELLKAAIKTDDPNAPLIADDQNGKGYCKWCLHRENCEALKKSKIENVLKNAASFESSDDESKSFFDNVSLLLANPEVLTNENLSKFLDLKTDVLKAFTIAEKIASNRITEGQNVPDYCMKSLKSFKQWGKSKEEIEKFLKNRKYKKEDIHVSSFVTPAKVLEDNKLTKKQKDLLLEKYIDIVPSKKSLTKMKEGDKEKSNAEFLKEIQEEIQREKNIVSFL